MYQFITVCALKHALLKAGAKHSSPYTLNVVDIVLDFGISGQPRAKSEFGTPGNCRHKLHGA